MKDQVLSTRVTLEDFLIVKRFAKEAELSVSDYITNKIFNFNSEQKLQRHEAFINDLSTKLRYAESKNEDYFNESQRLTLELDAMRDKLSKVEEENTKYEEEIESLKNKKFRLEDDIKLKEIHHRNHLKVIEDNKSFLIRIEDKLEDIANENTRQKEENQKLNEEIQALKEKAQQVDGLNDQIKELQAQVISVQQEAYASAAFYSGALKLYSKEEKKVQTMKEKHNVVIREMIHKLSHEPELFKNKGQFKFVEGEIWE